MVQREGVVSPVVQRVKDILRHEGSQEKVGIELNYSPVVLETGNNIRWGMSISRNWELLAGQ